MVKSTVDTKINPKYPYLGESSNGRVVLFIKEDTGVLVYDPSGSYLVGHYDNSWAEKACFAQSNVTVTLSND